MDATTLKWIAEQFDKALERVAAGESWEQVQPTLQLPAAALEAARKEAELVIASGSCDEMIGRPGLRDYLQRWYLNSPVKEIGDRRSRTWYLHLFNTEGDDSETPHDHPWYSLALQVSGALRENIFETGALPRHRVKAVRQGALSLRRPETIHAIDGGEGRPITLFVTGTRVRHWYFYPKEKNYQAVPHEDWEEKL